MRLGFSARLGSCRATGEKPIKILHVLSGLDRGGAELATLDVMRHVDRRLYQFHFCTLSGRPGTLEEEIRGLGGHVHRLCVKQLGFSRRFRALLGKHRFDVVHSHVHCASGHFLRLASQAGVPGRIAFFHNSRDGRGNGPVRRWYRAMMRKWISACATSVLANSDATMEAVWGPNWSGDPRYQVIHLGVAPSLLSAKPEREAVRGQFGLPVQARLFIHVGRITEQKNHLRLLAIFRAVAVRSPDARLLIVGRGGNRLERRVRERIGKLGLASRAILCGERTDIPRLLASSDLLVFPSRWEGLGLAVLESCAVGTPVVASDLPCVREIAAELPGIRRLSLELDDGTWARAILQSAAESGSQPSRQAMRARFAQSSFTMDRSVESTCRAWRLSTASNMGAGGCG
jgi:glycosyltransferase involved in cell wall biosynthesis